MKKIITLSLALFFSIHAYPQGIHHALYQFVYPNLNPALTASEVQNSKIGLIYRDQHFTVTPNSYKRISLSCEKKISNLKTQNAWAIGLRLHRNQAGALALTQSMIGVSLARQFYFDNQSSRISLGAEGAYSTINANDANKLLLEELILNGNITESIPFLNTKQILYGLGIAYDKMINKKYQFNIAYGYRYLSTGSQLTNSLLNDNVTMHNVLTKLRKQNKSHWWEVSINGQLRSKANEWVAQSFVGFKTHNILEEISFGLGYRNNDAIQYMIIGTLGQLKIGVAYEQNISSLTDASNGVGGYEFGATYVFKKKAKKIVDPPFVFTLEKDGLITQIDTMIHMDTLALIPVDKDSTSTTDKEEMSTDTITKMIDVDIIDFTQIEKADSILDFETIVYFDFDKSNIKEEYDRKLKQLMIYLSKTKYKRVQLEAHTDCRGSNEYNVELSKRRVNSVADWMAEKGITNQLITRLYKGEDFPAVKCEPCNSCNEIEHALNRRVEIKVWK